MFNTLFPKIVQKKENILETNQFFDNTIDSSFDLDSPEIETPSLSDNEINGSKQKVWGQNKYKLVPTETRNVLLCGRTRSGKTTAINLLKDPCYSPIKNSIFSDTVNPKFQSFAIQTDNLDSNSRKFTINVIDTPGLFEVKNEKELNKTRSNEIIQGVISKCLENEITNIHVLLIFVAFEQGIHPHDIDAMKIFLEMFGGNKVKIGLCITRADNHDLKWREEMKNQLLEHNEIKEMVKKENMEIKFIGCADLSSGRYQTEDQLLKGYKSAYIMRKELLELIFSADHRVQMSELNITQTSIKRIQEAIENLNKSFIYFSELKDFNNQDAQERLIEHQKFLSILSNDKAFVSLPQFSQAMASMLMNISILKSSHPVLDENISVKLFHPLFTFDTFI